MGCRSGSGNRPTSGPARQELSQAALCGRERLSERRLAGEAMSPPSRQGGRCEAEPAAEIGACLGKPWPAARWLGAVVTGLHVDGVIAGAAVRIGRAGLSFWASSPLIVRT